MNFKNRRLVILALIAFSIPAIWKIIMPGYFQIHDNNQVARVLEMHQALAGREFPVRWAKDLGFGYGYPIFNFYNPLPYYFGALFMFFGFDALAAAKIMFIFPIIFSISSMYIFSRLILGKWGAILAGIFYLYAPYHGVQIFVRGSVAEYWAYAILPLLFWAIWKRKFLPSILALTLLILSHNLTSFMSIPFIFLLILIKFFNTKNKLPFTPHQKTGAGFIIHCLLFLMLALGLSAFFWIPALVQSKFTLVDQMVFKEFDPPALHIVQPSQLWSSPWGYGGSSAGIDDGLSLQLGKIHLTGSILMIIVLVSQIVIKRNHKSFNPLILYSCIAFFFSLFMLLPPSIPVWSSFKFLSYIQFPWRFLTFASLFSSPLSALAVSKILDVIPATAGIYKNNLNRFRISLRDSGMTIVCLLFITYSLKFFQPQFKYSTTAKELTSRERLVWEVSLRSYEYLPQGFIVPKSQKEALRINNSQNKFLIEEFKQKTRPLQIFSNIVSLTALATLIGYYFYAQSRNYRRIIS